MFEYLNLLTVPRFILRRAYAFGHSCASPDKEFHIRVSNTGLYQNAKRNKKARGPRPTGRLRRHGWQDRDEIEDVSPRIRGQKPCCCRPRAFRRKGASRNPQQAKAQGNRQKSRQGALGRLSALLSLYGFFHGPRDES